ncbi:MAG: hypothetical protein ACLTJG_08515 [[Clostridium] innocuum]
MPERGGLDTKVLDMKQYDMVVNVGSCSYLRCTNRNIPMQTPPG